MRSTQGQDTVSLSGKADLAKSRSPRKEVPSRGHKVCLYSSIGVHFSVVYIHSPTFLEDVDIAPQCELRTEQKIVSNCRQIWPNSDDSLGTAYRSDVEDNTAPETVEVTESAAPVKGGKMSTEDALKEVLKKAMVCKIAHEI